MDEKMNTSSLLKHPSAFMPLIMSGAALGIVLVALVVHGPTPTPQADEGALARIWQLLIAGQLPIILFFALKWLPRAPKQALLVLVMQACAALASMLPVFLLHW